jgi:hypothetical protein
MFALRAASGIFLTRVATVALILVIAGATPRVFAANPVPLQNLSTSERVSTAPDSTLVKVGPKITTTLGKLRAAHKAHEASLANANAAGAAAHAKLRAKPMLVIKKGTIGPVLGGFAHPSQAPYKTIPRVGGVNPVQVGGLITNIVEPSSQYASAPPDMRAFCAAAQASACAYLPSQTQVDNVNGTVEQFDSLLTSTQCSQEGGAWTSFGWGSYFCQFNYPASVVVHFTPASNYQISQSASCNSPWTYSVDPKGAISIQLGTTGPYANWTTPNNATCVVLVSVGG